MVIGSIICEIDNIKSVTESLRRLKVEHGLHAGFEAKWTKISPAKLDYYAHLLRFFIEDDRLRFRGVVVRDKTQLNHEKFNQTHNDWYYKMYYTMLKYIIAAPNHYRVYVDIKDSRGGPKTKDLHDFLAWKIHDDEKQYMERVQQIRSNESELLQVADIVVGCLQYYNRNLSSSPAKSALVDILRTYKSLRSLNTTSSFGSTKFNILAWNPQEDRL